jgi:hypothetical protein
MKKLLFSLVVVLIATACCKLKDESVTYYSEDYKDSDLNFLEIHSSEIDAIWVKFTETGKHKDAEYTQYTLTVKSDGELYSETGTFETDWQSTITFAPEAGQSYLGTWVGGDKEKYTLAHELKDGTQEITFIYKGGYGKK